MESIVLIELNKRREDIVNKFKRYVPIDMMNNRDFMYEHRFVSVMPVKKDKAYCVETISINDDYYFVELCWSVENQCLLTANAFKYTATGESVKLDLSHMN